MSLLRWLLPLAFMLPTLPAWSFDEADPLLVEARLEPVDWNPGQAGRLTLKLTLPEGYHGYEDQFRLTLLEPDGFHLGPWKVAPVHEFYDKFSKKHRRGMKTTAEMTAGVEAPSRFARDEKRMRLELVYQACSDSFCLFPTTKIIDVPLTLVGAPVSEKPAGGRVASPPADDGMMPMSWLSTDQLNRLLGESRVLALFFVFLAGILTSFTPCIFPMIPITLAILGHHAEQRSRLQNFLLSVCYVLGIASTYSIMGVIAATSGAVFGASLGNPWVLGVICFLFLVMSFSMYGFYELQVPAFLRNSLGARKSGPGYVGAYGSGLIAGIVASPCVGPVLVGILAWVATTGSKLFGFLLLFSYALGLGLIFLFLGVFTEFTRRLPRSGPWLETVKFVLGSLMLGAFYYYLSLLVPQSWHDAALGLGLVILGSLGGAFAPLKGTTAFKKIKKGLSQAFLILGFGYLVLGVFDLRPFIQVRMMDPGASAGPGVRSLEWQPYSEEALQAAAVARQPVIIDFWAEWCAACHELEQHSFSHPRVRALLGSFVRLKYDATKDSADLRALKKRWKIQGLPTVLFVNPNGVWLEGLTLTEFEKPEAFIRRVEKAMN
ncbi:MAG: thioredoxin family protein [Bdellovibrionaceae bacterium]|nr:thioredoxin family protein [Pseudobdellovibrionaceae bacterium]